MKISSIVDITGGVLQNTPSISFITQQHTDITKVHNGDLFISSSISQIKEAVAKGAFCIIYDIDLNLSQQDTEIAWIQVDNITKAIIRLLRYRLSTTNIKSFYLDCIDFDILKTIITNKQTMLFLGNNIKTEFELIDDTEKQNLLICNTKELLGQITPHYHLSKYKSTKITNLTIHSLFKLSFSYKGKYYNNIDISYLYLNNLLNIIDFCDDNCIAYDLSKLSYLNYMKPIFLDQQNQPVDFGKSHRFVLANSNPKIIKKELEFISQYYKYGKISVIDGNCFDEILLEQISNLDFNLLYIKNRPLSDIVRLLTNNKDYTNTLFS